MDLYYVDHCIYAEKIEPIEKIVKTFIQVMGEDPAYDSCTSEGWMGHFILASGNNPEDYDCRSWISDAYFVEDEKNHEYRFYIETLDAWTPKTAPIEALLVLSGVEQNCNHVYVIEDCNHSGGRKFTEFSPDESVRRFFPTTAHFDEDYNFYHIESDGLDDLYEEIDSRKNIYKS